MNTRSLLFVGTLLLPAGVALGAAGLANPAAELCVKDGAKVEIETAANGSESGMCVFPNGERIKEWAYFRNKHRTSR